MWTKNITKLAFKCWNFLYNVFFYSKYRVGLKFLNCELQLLCVMNCKKINKCIGNQQCNRHLTFPGQQYSFQWFFQTFPYLWSFSRLFKALKISTLNFRTFHTFPGSVQTLISPQDGATSHITLHFPHSGSSGAVCTSSEYLALSRFLRVTLPTRIGLDWARFNVLLDDTF